jgi:hypothetical protein
VPVSIPIPSDPDPDDRDPEDFVTEDQLCTRGIDPTLVGVLCPWATGLRSLDDSRCWLRLDLAVLLEGN